METTQKSFLEKLAVPAIIIFALILCGILYAKNSTPAKPTIDNKVEQLKTLRAEKKQKEQEVYTINQKIIPLKCSIYSDVWAKEQWDTECQDFYEEQQAKIREGSDQALKVAPEEMTESE